jgi:hypothetical protein
MNDGQGGRYAVNAYVQKTADTGTKDKSQCVHRQGCRHVSPLLRVDQKERFVLEVFLNAMLTLLKRTGVPLSKKN